MKFRGVNSLLFSLVFCLCLSLGAQDRHAIQKYTGLVNDFAKILEPGQLQILEAKLRKYEDSTSTQIFVAIEADMPIDDAYTRAMEYARGWGVGSKEKNNGVLLYIAINNRKYFTVTSQAVQGKLTDGTVGQIERNLLVPNMKVKDYFAAIDQTTTGYMQALAGEFKALSQKQKKKVPGWITFAIIFGIIFIIGLFNNKNHGRGIRGGGAFWIPGSFGGGGWGGGSGGGGWGGAGGGGGFDGGGAGGSW